MTGTASLWQRYQDWLYYHEGLGLYLDVSRMRFDDAFVAQMQPKLAKAFGDMTALESGAIANPDEQRMVGHYWLRQPDLAPTPELRDDIINTLDRLETFTAAIHNGQLTANGQPFTDVLSIGIGGSALGPQFVAEALAPNQPPLAIHFVDNTDPDGIDRILSKSTGGSPLRDRLATTLVLIISKSGGTPETRNGMVEIQAEFGQAGLPYHRNFVAITCEGSALDQRAIAEGWLDRFPMFDWVGGRTSELSAVGLLPAALQGIQIREMLLGAQMMDQATRDRNLKTNPAALLALCWYSVGRGKGEKDMVVLPYKDRLLLFSRYLQQLVMESLGKERDLDGNLVYQGIAVYGNKGSTDQHAYVQQLREGVPNFFATLIEVLEDGGSGVVVEDGAIESGDYLSGLLQGTRQALYDNNRESITITVPRVSERIVGALIALYERAVSFYASLVNINAYHQPGVEAGKKAAANILALQKRLVSVLQDAGEPLLIAELATQVGAIEQVETIYWILRHLAANGRGPVLVGNPGQPASLKVSWK